MRLLRPLLIISAITSLVFSSIYLVKSIGVFLELPEVGNTTFIQLNLLSEKISDIIEFSNSEHLLNNKPKYIITQFKNRLDEISLDNRNIESAIIQQNEFLAKSSILKNYGLMIGVSASIGLLSVAGICLLNNI